MHEDLRFAFMARRQLLMRTNMTSLLNRFPSVASPTRQLWTLALAHFAARTQLPGDSCETGVYLGGCSVLMMRVLDMLGSTRLHWACDSFVGLPSPVSQDRESCDHRPASERDSIVSCTAGKAHAFRASKARFQANVALFNVSTTRLRIVPGWFEQSLPAPGMRQLSFLRLDGDMYISTRDALEKLYPLLVPGGVIYVDDAGSFAGCWRAVSEYRDRHNVTEPMHRVLEAHLGFAKYEAVWWIKRPASPSSHRAATREGVSGGWEAAAPGPPRDGSQWSQLSGGGDDRRPVEAALSATRRGSAIRALPAPNASATALGPRWLLAVGSSPLRIVFSALAELLLTKSERVKVHGCFPSWRFLHQGACMAQRLPAPCVLDMSVAGGGRLSFVWSFGFTTVKAGRSQLAGRHHNLIDTAVRRLLEDAAPRTPDLLVLNDVAPYYWDNSHMVWHHEAPPPGGHDLLRLNTRQLDSLDPLLPSASRRVLLGMPWGTTERELPRLLEHNSKMRRLAARRGMGYIDASAPCVDLARRDLLLAGCTVIHPSGGLDAWLEERGVRPRRGDRPPLSERGEGERGCEAQQASPPPHNLTVCAGGRRPCCKDEHCYTGVRIPRMGCWPRLQLPDEQSKCTVSPLCTKYHALGPVAISVAHELLLMARAAPPRLDGVESEQRAGSTPRLVREPDAHSWLPRTGLHALLRAQWPKPNRTLCFHHRGERVY